MVTVAHPSKAMLRIINPIMRLLVHTPIAGGARKQFMVLTVHGRKTGRQYEIPLSAHFIDNTLYAMTDATWKYNFRDGATAEVLLDGKTTTMHGELIDDGATRREPVPPLRRVLRRQTRAADDGTDVPRSADPHVGGIHRGGRP